MPSKCRVGASDVGLKPQSEAEFTRAVVAFARLKGWRVHHCLPGRVARGRWVTPLLGDPGLPDLILLRGNSILVAELKIGKNVLSDAQSAWLGAFRLAGVPAYTWRPEDWSEIERILG
jgi:hypothetical protein